MDLEWLSGYGLFLVQALTVTALALAGLSIFVGRGAARRRRADQIGGEGRLHVLRVNDKYRSLDDEMKKAFALDFKGRVRRKKERRRTRRVERRQHRETDRKRLFLLNYRGDIQASQTDSLRWELTAALSQARAGDEVVVCVESAGGLVHGYGLAAAQLERVRRRGVPLTVCVDKIAASGGYLMACVADTIVAAPFALVGSIGVALEMPNFHRFLKRHDIDYEMLTAGEHKRDLSVFGPNTEQGREKKRQDLKQVHALFQRLVADRRPQVDLAQVATGEVWCGQDALERRLVDRLGTSDEYLLEQRERADIYRLEYRLDRPWPLRGLEQMRNWLSRARG